MRMNFVIFAQTDMIKFIVIMSSLLFPSFSLWNESEKDDGFHDWYSNRSQAGDQIIFANKENVSAEVNDFHFHY